MTFDAETLSYLHGSKFSNALKVKIDYLGDIPDRVSFLVDLMKGKRIVHLGCLDHKPLIEEKINRKKWLHKELTECASECVGVDIDADTFAFVRERFPFDNIYLSDFTREVLPQIQNNTWDYAVLGELLEHIDNPVDFLRAIRNNYKGAIAKIVITVPNAWTRTTMRMATDSVEIINSDHRYWFTPYTLAKVMFQAGIETEEIFFANRVPLSKKELAAKRMLALVGQSPKYNFTYASSIVAIGTF